MSLAPPSDIPHVVVASTLTSGNAVVVSASATDYFLLAYPKSPPSGSAGSLPVVLMGATKTAFRAICSYRIFAKPSGGNKSTDGADLIVTVDDSRKICVYLLTYTATDGYVSFRGPGILSLKPVGTFEECVCVCCPSFHFKFFYIRSFFVRSHYISVVSFHFQCRTATLLVSTITPSAVYLWGRLAPPTS